MNLVSVASAWSAARRHARVVLGVVSALRVHDRVRAIDLGQSRITFANAGVGPALTDAEPHFRQPPEIDSDIAAHRGPPPAIRGVDAPLAQDIERVLTEHHFRLDEKRRAAEWPVPRRADAGIGSERSRSRAARRPSPNYRTSAGARRPRIGIRCWSCSRASRRETRTADRCSSAGRDNTSPCSPPSRRAPTSPFRIDRGRRAR